MVTVLQLVAAGASDSSEFHPRGRAPLRQRDAVPTYGEPSHRMTAAEIEAVVEGHALFARLAVENGMDSVELLGGYGYLIHQSLSLWGNGRDDEWGGPLGVLAGRPLSDRAAIGPDRILGFRMPVDDDRTPFEGGDRRDKLADLARQLVDTGCVDYLNPCMGSRVYEYTARTARSYRHAPGVDLPLRPPSGGGSTAPCR